MSAKLMGKVWDCDLDHSKQSVLLSLADHAKDDGSDVYPSIGYTAWKTGYSTRQVQRIILDLVTEGILTLVQPPYRGKPTEYKINIEAARLKKAYSPEPWSMKRGPKPADPKNDRGDKLSPQRTASTGDKLSPQTEAPQPIGGDTLSPQGRPVGVTIHTDTGDIPQPNGVTSGAVTGDISGDTGDTAVSQEPLNHQEPSGLEPLECRTTPPTPPRNRAGGNTDNFWSCILRELKDELDQLSLRGTQFAHLPYDYDAMFRDTWQARIEDGVLYVGSADPEASAEGLRKYERRITQIAMRLFRLEMKFQAEAKAA